MKIANASALPSALALVGAAAFVSGVLAYTMPARADTPGRNWASVEQVTRAIANQGYRVIEIEADDGQWEGEMVKENIRYDLHADPRTGRPDKGGARPGLNATGGPRICSRHRPRPCNCHKRRKLLPQGLAHHAGHRRHIQVASGRRQARTDVGACMMQSAAIPYRVTLKGDLEVLLVTSRKRARWVLPKGNVPIGMAPHRSAAREALEEAGVFGTVERSSFGAYDERKVGWDGEQHMITVRAFPLLVTSQLQGWAEAHQRQRKWLSARQAASAVKNRSLRNLLDRFARERATG